jgi:hypothetical protein
MRRTRYALAGIAIGAVAAVASPALGLFGANGHEPALVADKVQHLVSLELRNGKTASLWQGPTADGGVCTLFHVAPASSAATPPTLGTAGYDCIAGPARAPQPAPFQTALDWTRSDTGSGYGLIVYGHVSVASRISRVDLSVDGSVQRLPFAKGYFLVELPDVPAAGDLPNDGPYVLKGYGSDGRLVASLDLAHVVEMASPPKR